MSHADAVLALMEEKGKVQQKYDGYRSEWKAFA